MLSLSLSPNDDLLRSNADDREPGRRSARAGAGSRPQIRFVTECAPGESLRERNERARDERQAAAESHFMNDPDVQRLISQHGAKVVPDSIRPFDEN